MKLRDEIEALRDHVSSRGMDNGQAVELLSTYLAGVIATHARNAGQFQIGLHEIRQLIDERASALWADLKVERYQ